MAFCPQCGKQLNEGEVCSCQADKKTVAVKAAANSIIGNAKDIVNQPEEGVGRFTAGISWLNIVIIAGIYGVVRILSNLWMMIKANIDRKERLEEYADKIDMDLEEYIDEFDLDVLVYEFGDIIKNVFLDVLLTAAGVAVTAVVFYFAVKLIKKLQITWKTAFAIAVIDLMIVVPLMLVNEILGLIPDFKLLDWIISAISSVSTWGSVILTYLGIKSVCGDTKSTVYTMILGCAVCSIATSLVNFLLVSLF